MDNILNYYKNKRVLITGSCGFKGTWLAFWLHELGAKVYGYSLKPENNNFYQSIEGQENFEQLIIGDICNLEFQTYIQQTKPQIVFHLAAQPIVSIGYNKPYTTYNSNIMGTVNLLEGLRQAHQELESIVIITTDKVYEESINGHRENDKLFGLDPYACSKACSDLIAQSYYHSYFKTLNIPMSVFRAGNVVGGGDFTTSRLIPDYIQSGDSFTMRNPNGARPYQHVISVLYAYLQMGAYQVMNPTNNLNIYNIGPIDNKQLSNIEIIQILEQYLINVPKTLTTLPTISYHEADKLYLDITHYLTDWKQYGLLIPDISITDTLWLTASWYNLYSKGPENWYKLKHLMREQINFVTGGDKKCEN